MTSRSVWAVLAVAAMLGGLLVGGRPATAAPAVPVAPAQGWHPDVKKPDPVTIPGTNRKVTPFATPLRPTQPKALPGVRPGTGAVLKADDPATAAVRRAAPPKLGKAAAGPDDPTGGLFCSEQVTRNGFVSGSPNQLDYAANISYLAEFGCNFYLNAAYVATGVIDRGRFDGQFLYTTTPVVYGPTAYGATSGGVSIPGELFDGGRQVEIAFELFLRTPYGIPWGGCFPVPLRYLLCEGLNTDVLHIVLGTGTFSTGLAQPVIRYAALGDSFSSGTGSPPYADEQCKRTPAAYPSLIAGALAGGLPLDRPADATCHRANLNHMYTSQYPGVPPQLDAVRPNTRLVTLTIGGNNLGFTDALIRCTLTDCSTGGPLVTSQQLFEVQTQLTALYRQIRAEMRPDGRLFVLSYPAVLPDPNDVGDPQPTEERCFGTNANLQYPERILIYQAFAAVDKMIRDAVIATGDSGVTYVNGLDLFRGHRVCSGDGNEWANGYVSPLDESFHPKAAGHLAIATRLRSLLNPL